MLPAITCCFIVALCTLTPSDSAPAWAWAAYALSFLLAVGLLAWSDRERGQR